MEKFNLIYKPWIPCSNSKGVVKDYSLQDILNNSHKLISICANEPIVNVAIYRLLLAILTRVFGGVGYKHWNILFKKGEFDVEKLNAYFIEWEHRFNLLDEERPFYQMKDDRVKSKSLLKLMPHLSSGNNATLFDHHTEAEGIVMTSAEATRFLITLQSFGLGGLSGIKAPFTAAPPSRGVSFFIQGDTLFESLMFNMIEYGKDTEKPIPTDSELDLPCWEMQNPFEERTEPYGLLDYLTWQNRRILLIPEERKDDLIMFNAMTEGPGLRLTSDYFDNPAISDPYQYYRMGSTKKPIVIRFNEGQALWRNSAVLFEFSRTLLPPTNLCWIKELVEKEHLSIEKTYPFIGLGMSADKAKVLFYREESLKVPLVYLKDPKLVARLQQALGWAENISKGLYGAVSSFAETLLSFGHDLEGGRSADKKDIGGLRDHFGADRVFWGELELYFYQLMEDLPNNEDEALSAWQIKIEESANKALEHAIKMAGDSVSVKKGAVKARSILARRIYINFYKEE